MISLVVFFPLLAALLLLFVPKANWVRPVALALSIVEFVFSLHFVCHFDKSTAALQFVERHAWVPDFGIQYFVGIDGLSLWLVLLSTFLVPLMILGSWKSITDRVKTFHVCLMVLTSAMIGSFVALDMILFYSFWELSLIPMYLIIGIWGGPRRIYASIKFFLFTMFGSVLMLIAIITLMYMTKEQLGTMSASVLDFYKLTIPFVEGTFLNPQTLMFFAFALAFAIKVPMFPVHTWLPDAHTEAPTSGSVVLASVMLKMGAYGFLRFALPIFPQAVTEWTWLFLFLGVVGIIYGALVAMVQPDLKKLVAYSSVSHMGYVMLGLFAMNAYGVTGGIYQMLNHGISTGALFLLVGMMYDRTHSRKIVEYGGLAIAMPVLAIFFFIVTLSSIALPGTNGFIGEFLILMGTFMKDKMFGSFAVLGVILGAIYMLWMYKKIFFGEKGPLVRDEAHPLHDLDWREKGLLSVFVVVIFWMGIYPKYFTDYMKISVQHLTENVNEYRLDVVGDTTPPQARLGE